jgi:hypothetical protein
MGMTATVIIGGVVAAATSALAFSVGRYFLERRLRNGPFDKHYEISVVAKREAVPTHQRKVVSS